MRGEGGGRLTLLLSGTVLERDCLFEHSHLFRRESAVLGEEHDLLQEGRLLVALVGGEEDVLEVGEGGGRVAGELRRVQVVDCVHIKSVNAQSTVVKRRGRS